MKLRLPLTLTLLTFCLSLAAQASGPEPKDLTFNIKRIESFTGYAVQLTPPAGHHFNMEAPTKISVQVGKDKLDAQLSKVPADIKASWNKELTQCDMQVQVYLCDDKNTYCVPVKKEFKCEKLTFQDTSASTGSSPSTSTSSASDSASSSKSGELFLLNESAQAFALAKTEKKLILIDFFAIWCPPCNMLEETVFSDKKFIALKKDFVFLKMDVDQASSWELKSKYNVKGYPTVLIINPEGEEIMRILGSRKPKTFLASLKQSLKYKNTSLAERQAQADSLKNPTAAVALADLYLGQENYNQALHYFQVASRNAPLSNENRIKMTSAMIGILEESKDSAAQKSLSMLLRTALETDPYGIEAYERADKLARLAEELKDEGLKNRALTAQFKNAEYLLKNPKLYVDSELSEADLYTIQADVYENQKNEAKMRESYGKAYEAYTRELKDLKMDESKERGNNLERTYALFKSGKTEEANALYEKLEAQYPEEFTFYYAHAVALHEQGKFNLALTKAEKALKYSYGDNMLRAVKQVADLRFKAGMKNEAIGLLDDTLKNFKAPEDSKVRTHRYLANLRELKEKISKQ